MAEDRAEIFLRLAPNDFARLVAGSALAFSLSVDSDGEVSVQGDLDLTDVPQAPSANSGDFVIGQLDTGEIVKFDLDQIGTSPPEDAVTVLESVATSGGDYEIINGRGTGANDNVEYMRRVKPGGDLSISESAGVLTFSVTNPTVPPEVLDGLQNIGTGGYDVFKEISGTTGSLRRIKVAGDAITGSYDGDTILLTVNHQTLPSNFIDDATTVGTTGTPVLDGIVSNELQLRRIKGIGGISVSEAGGEIAIDGSGVGGGPVSGTHTRNNATPYTIDDDDLNGVVRLEGASGGVVNIPAVSSFTSISAGDTVTFVVAGSGQWTLVENGAETDISTPETLKSEKQGAWMILMYAGTFDNGDTNSNGERWDLSGMLEIA